MENARYKILLIEDNELDQMAFKRFIAGNAIPYDCTVAGSVTEAKHILAENQFDIIVSDHSLGDGTAIDVLRSAQNAPVIVVTGAGDEETAVNAWKAGAYDYLVKDINQSYLKAIPITVENAIRHNMVEKKVQLLSGAVMSTEDSVYITDMQGKIIFVNKAFCKTYGYKEDEIVGKNGNVLWIGRHQSQNTRSVFQTRTVGSTWEVGFYHKRKDDSVFPVSLSRSNIKDSGGKDVAIVGVARDITDRILVEDEIRTASLKLKKKNQLQNEIAIMVTETLQKLLASNNLDMAKRLVDDYLDISRIESEKLELNSQPFNLTSLLCEALEAFGPLAGERKIDLKNLTAEPELVVTADQDRIAQVLVSLLSRAIKFSPPGGHVSIQAKDAGHELCIEIRDDSPPLERNEIHRIVHRSDWIREQFNAGREDLALGLRIAKELVEMHGGRIWAESSDTKRNIFCFTVPKVTTGRKAALEVSAADAI